MDTQTQKLMFSSKSNEWETPEDFYNKLNNKFKFTLDPCSTHENHKCDKYYTMHLYYIVAIFFMLSVVKIPKFVFPSP